MDQTPPTPANQPPQTPLAGTTPPAGPATDMSPSTEAVTPTASANLTPEPAPTEPTLPVTTSPAAVKPHGMPKIMMVLLGGLLILIVIGVFVAVVF